MDDVDLESLYKQSQTEGLIETVQTASGDSVDLESLYEDSKKGIVSEAPKEQVIQTAKTDSIESRLQELIPSRKNPFMEGAEAIKSAYSSPVNLEGIGKRGIAGLQVLAAPYIAAESIVARRAMSGQEGLSKFISPKQMLSDVAQGIVGGRATLGDVNYRAGLSRPIADFAGTAQSLTLQAPELLQGGVNLVKKVPGAVSLLGKKLGVGLNRDISVAQEKLSSIAQTAARETGASKAQVAYNVKNLKEAKAASLGRFETLNKEAEAINAQSIAQAEGKKSVLGQKLPDVAYKSGQNIKEKFISTIRQHSEEYGKTLDNLIGGKNTDIYISNNEVLSSIEDALLDRSVPMSFNKKGKLVVEGAASSAENKLVNLYNKLSQGGEKNTIGVRELLKNKQMLGRGVKYGKSYGYEDDLIADVVQRLGKRAEADIPGLKELNQTTSRFLKVKDEANRRLDLFKQGSPRPREFVESYAKGQLSPEEKVFLDSFKKELPDFDRLSKSPKALAQGMDEYDKAIEALKKSPKEALPQISGRFDEEIAKLQSALDIDKARIGNEALAKSKPLIENISKMESKLRKLKLAKDALITVGSIGGAYYGLRAVLNYGFNTLFSD